MPLSRQEQIRPLIEQFSKGKNITDRLVLELYPSELDRFKEDFPELNFTVISSRMTVLKCKIYKVRIKSKK